jgi:anaerobic magnesium-protoporphyrin IX monomethyl ester cyclase
MIKKIALVRPGEYPEGLIIPLSLMYLASYARKYMPDIEFKVIDGPLDDLTSLQVAQRVHEFAPDLVALTGLSFHTPYVKEAAREIRELCPLVPIVVGGAGTSSDPGDVLKETAINYGVIKEGEKTFLELIEVLNANKNPYSVKGLAFQDKNGKVIINPEQPLADEMDDIPFPAYDLIEVERYFQSAKRTSQSPVYVSKKLLPVLTSRGCPFKCVFCHDTLGKDFRHRSPDNIVNEIVWLKEKYDFEELEIVDDIFNFDIRHAKEVFRKLIDKNLGLKIAFPNGIKYEMIDTELLQLFKQGGVYRIAFGIESGDVQGQKLVRKKTNLKRMNEIIEEADKMGFFVSGFFQIGLPGETREMIENTINFAVGSNLHTAMFHVTTPFPGTPMFVEHVQNTISSGNFNGSREEYEEELRTKVNFRGARDISLNLSKVSDAELLSLKRKAFAKFYFSPKRILGLYRVTPVKKRLFKNFINVCSEIIFRRWLVQA